MSKIKNVLNTIVRYKALFILLYEFLILSIFYLICQFKFEHYQSIVMILLMVIVPIILNIVYKMKKIKNKKLFLLRSTDYIEQIERDVKSGKFQKEFIDEIKKLISCVQLKYSKINILIECGDLNILIDDNLIKMFIVNTKIVYQYVYGYKIEEPTKYDVKGLSNYPTSYLYQTIINDIKKLTNKELEYEETYYGKEFIGCELKFKSGVIYQQSFNYKKKLFKNIRKNKKIININ